MLSDFTKLNTFLTVVKEKSFSKASIKLDISQPAVTQQMRFIEDYLGTKILDRKKNGIRLTNEGEKLFNIAQKIQKVLISSQQQLTEIINKDITFVISTSTVIGDYIIPTFLNTLRSKIDNEVNIDVGLSRDAVDLLLDKKSDIALIESPIFEDEVVYEEWIEDEIVIFSNQEIPKRLSNEDLKSFKWVCRNENSHTRKLFKEYLDLSGYSDCETFNKITESSSLTTILRTVLHSKEEETPTVSIASYRALKAYESEGKLFVARLPKTTMKRNLYIAYLKNRKEDETIQNVLSYLKTIS